MRLTNLGPTLKALGQSVVEFGWLWVATGLGIVVREFSVNVWGVTLYVAPETLRWVAPVLLCGVAPFLIFHRMRLERDRAARDAPWSVETLDYAYEELADAQDRAKDLIDLIERSADAFVPDALGNPSPRQQLQWWARDTSNFIFQLMGRIASHTLYTADDFADYQLTEPVAGLNHAAATRHRLIAAATRAKGAVSALWHAIATERMKRDRPDLA